LTVDPTKKIPSPPFQQTACSSHLPRSSGLIFLCFRHRGTNMPRCQDFLKLGTGHSVKHRCLNALSPSLAPAKAHIVASLRAPSTVMCSPISLQIVVHVSFNLATTAQFFSITSVVFSSQNKSTSAAAKFQRKEQGHWQYRSVPRYICTHKRSEKTNK